MTNNQKLLEALKHPELFEKEEFQNLIIERIQQNKTYRNFLLQMIKLEDELQTKMINISREYIQNTEIKVSSFIEKVWSSQYKKIITERFLKEFIEIKNNNPQQWEGIQFNDVPLYTILVSLAKKIENKNRSQRRQMYVVQNKNLTKKGEKILLELNATPELIELWQKINATKY